MSWRGGVGGIMSNQGTSHDALGEAWIEAIVRRRGRRPWLGVLASVAVGIGLIILLLSQIDPMEVVALCRRVDLRWGLAGAICFAGTYLFRAVRFRVLLAEGQTTLGRMYSVACVHGMLNHILPVRVGELSYLYLVRRVFDVSLGEAAVSLLVARLFDYVVVALIFVVAAVRILPTLSGAVTWYLGGAAGLALLALILLLLARRVSGWLRGRAVGGSRGGRGARAALLDWFEAKLSETDKGLERTSQGIVRIRTVLSSLLVWIGVFGTFFCFLRGLGFVATAWFAIVGSTFAVLTSVLPLSGIGSFGTLEAGWTAGFLLIGFTKEEAIASGFAVHLLVFATVVLLGLAGAVAIVMDRSR
jgi:uncharacterized membrane protein YbhN (UPF0104 family)